MPFLVAKNSLNFKPVLPSTIVRQLGFDAFGCSFVLLTVAMSRKIAFSPSFNGHDAEVFGAFFCFAFPTVHASHGFMAPTVICHPNTLAASLVTSSPQ
jgi:hypothetical protein